MNTSYESSLPLAMPEFPQLVKWVHPSVRDMVIEELMTNDVERSHFLRHSSPVGLALALSVAGGRSGTRLFPLMRSDSDWSDVAERSAHVLLHGNLDDRSTLLSALATASLAVKSDRSSRLHDVIRTALSSLADAWDATSTPIPLGHLGSYFWCGVWLDPAPRTPFLGATWDHYVEGFISFGQLVDFDAPDVERAAKWFDLVSLLERFESRALRRVDFPDSMVEPAKQVYETLIGWLKDLEYLDPDEYDPEHLQPAEPSYDETVERFMLDPMLELYEKLQERFPMIGIDEDHESVLLEHKETRGRRSENWAEWEERHADYEEGDYRSSDTGPSVSEIFSDL
jgi:hypothetical protein